MTTPPPEEPPEEPAEEPAELAARPKYRLAAAMIAAGLVATGVGMTIDKSRSGPSPAATSASGTRPPAQQTGDAPVVVRRAMAVAMSAAQDASRPVPLTALRLGASPHLSATTDGRLLISDPKSRRVYTVGSDDSDATTIAGDGTDGTSPTSVLQEPGPVAVDSFGGIIIADQPVSDRPGRILRIDPSGQSALLAEITTKVDYLYTDDIGSVLVQLTPDTADADTAGRLIRIGAAGEISETTLPAGTSQLIAVAGGKWFALTTADPTLIGVSLFGSTTDGLPDLRLSGFDTVRDGPLTVAPLGGSRFASVECRLAGPCQVRVHDPSGAPVATMTTGDGPASAIGASRVSSLVGRSGGFDLATADGQILRIDNPLSLAQPRVLVGVGEAVSEDVVLDGPPPDAHLNPAALTVAPDGTVFWIDLYPSVSLGALGNDARIHRLVLPGSITRPQQLVASEEGLLVLGQGLVHLLPYDTLRVGQMQTREQAARSEQRPAGDPIVGSIVALTGLPDGTWTSIDANEAKLINGSDAIGTIAEDNDGFVAYVDGKRLLGFDRVSGKRTEIATTANTADDVSAATFGLPETEIGTVGGIVAVGRRTFVVADPSSDRLTLVEQTSNSTWRVSRFLGMRPGTVTGSPLSQRTVRPRLITKAADGTLFFTTEGGAINRMGTDGTVRLVAGGAPAVSTPFGRIGGVAISAPDAAAIDQRLIVVADTARHRVVRVNRDGTQTILTGTGTAGAGPDDLDSPTAVAISAGLTVIADSANHRVVSIDVSGRRRTVAGTGVVGAGDATGAADLVALNNPTGVAINADGRIAIADTDNNRVLLVGADGQISSLASVDHPTGLAFQGANHLVISAPTDGQVYRVQLDTKARSVVAGVGVRGYQGDGGPATAARLQDPNGIALGPDGAIYVSDAGNGAIRKISADGRIDTLVGGDGSFTSPTGVTIDPLLGMIFGEADGRLFSVNTKELDAAVPNWFKTAG